MPPLHFIFCAIRRGAALSATVFLGGTLILSTWTTQILAQPASAGQSTGNEKVGNKGGWIGLSPFLWEISDSKSYTKISAGFDRGFYFKNRPSLMLGYTLAGAVHHNRSVLIAPEKIWSGHFLVEGRVRSMLGSGRDGLFLEGGLNFFLDDTLTLKIKELDFNLGGYAALGYQKTLAERLLIMPTLQYRHNDFMTRENGLYLRLGLGYLLKD
ncbi:MAG: hypothetical protein RLZZ121_92 [Bacteroidota bacterium]